jgi:hypothetical protein
MKHNYKKVLLISAITVVSSLKALAQQTTVVKREWFIQNEKVDTIPITATVLDINQNIITTGNAIVAGQSTNILTSKIAPDGTILWQQQLNGAANGKDFGTANCIDVNGNIYVAGAIYDFTNNFDYVIACYDQNGGLQWQQTFDGVAHSYDVPTAITTDNNGNIYVTGSSLGTTTLTDFVTLQLNASNGQINWVKTYNFANLYEIPISILKNSNGNIYVTGASASSLNNWDIATIEYDPSGNLVNQDRNTSISNGFDKPADMKKDANGNIYIVGRAVGANTNFDIKLIKLNSSLTVQWIKTFDGQGLNDEASSIEIDNNGNIIIAGYVQKPMDGKEYIIIKYDSNGTLLWQKEKDYSSDNGDNNVKKIAVDAAKNIYVTGESKENGETKIVTIKFDENGNEKWTKEFDQVGRDEVNNIRVDNDGNVYIIAKTTEQNNATTTSTPNENNTAIKYSQSEALIPPDFNNELPSANNLYYENRGQILNTNLQTANNVQFYTNGAFPQQYIQNNIISYTFAKGDTIGNDTIQRIDLKFLNSNSSAKLYPNEEQENGYLNYFKPNAPNGIVNVKGNNKIVVPNIYSNVDLIYSSNNASTKMYLVAKVGGKFDEVRLQISGTNQTAISNNNLTVNSNWNTFSVGKLTAYQLQGNTIVPIFNWIPTYNTYANNTYGFNIGTYNESLPLVIEISNDVQAVNSSVPLENIDWSTYYTQSGAISNKSAEFLGSTIDTQHNLIVVGKTNQAIFPITTGVFQSNLSGDVDAVALKFNALGQRLWATYYGGNSLDYAVSVVTNAKDEILFTGYTASTNFPLKVYNSAYMDNTTNATLNNYDAFIVRLNENGTNNIWSTYFGGSGIEMPYQINQDNNGNIFIVGLGDVNTPRLQQGNFYYPNGNGLFAKFDSTGVYKWSTGFGTISDDVLINSIDFDAQNNIYIGGKVGGVNDYPILNSQTYTTGQIPDYGFFVTKIDNENKLSWSEYLGRGGGSINLITYGNELYVSGTVGNSTTFNSLFFVNPSNGAYFDNTFNNTAYSDPYIARLAQSNGSVSWCTLFGGTNEERNTGLATDQFGNIYTTGRTLSTGFTPLTQPTGYFYQNINNAGYDHSNSYLIAFDSNNNVKWSTYFGGDKGDATNTISIDKSNNYLYLAGGADSQQNFPLYDGGGVPYFQNSIPTNCSGGFISRFGIASNFGLGNNSSINENALAIKNIITYPNPSTNILNFNSRELETKPYEIRITNVMGVEVLNLNNISSQNPIDVSSLANGIYNLSIKTGNKIYNSNFIKQ